MAVRRAFAGRDVAPIRLHGDCHGGNVLWTDDGPHFVDFDDARSGPAIQDLWMLLSGERAAMEAQLAIILGAYESFRDFDRRELALIEPLRTLRLLHYSAWIARRWNDPAFPAAFPWFNTQRYWQDRILELREQIALMDEPPLQRSERRSGGCRTPPTPHSAARALLLPSRSTTMVMSFSTQGYPWLTIARSAADRTARGSTWIRITKQNTGRTSGA